MYKRQALCYIVIVVVGGVDHEQRDVQLLRQILKPLRYLVADIVGHAQEIRHSKIAVLMHCLRVSQIDLSVGTDIVVVV